MATQEELEVVKEINKELARQVKFESKLARLNGESVDKLVERQSLLRQQRGTYVELQEAMRFSEEEMQKVLKAQQTEYLNLIQKGSEAEIEMSARRLEMLNEVNSLQKDFVSGDETRRKIAGEILVAMEKQAAAQAKIKDSQDAGIKAGAGMVSALNSVIKFQKDLDNTITGNLLKAIKTTEGFKETVTSIGIEMEDTFGPANALQFLITNSIQTAVALDGMQASFVRTTGASREFAESIEDVYRANSQNAVGLEDAANALSGLYTNFGSFSNLNKSTRDQITGTTAVLEQLGVSADTTGNNFNFLVSQLGMGVTAAEETIRSFTETGAAIGIPPQQLNSAFESLAPRLAAFGSKAPDIFMKSAKAAKSLGMTVDELGGTLFALSDGLDTFEESAGAVAAINLSLGGSFVNAFDLTMAAAEGPAAQLDMLRSGFDAAGKSLSGMPFFQQKMLASELGLELGVLKQVIDGNMDSSEALAKANPLEELAKNANSAMDKLNKAMQEISVGLQPLISLFGWLSENVSNFGMIVVGLVTIYKGYTGWLTLSTLALEKKVAVNAIAAASEAANTVPVVGNAAAEALLAAERKLGNVVQEQSILQNEVDTVTKFKNVGATNTLSFATKGLAASIGLVVLGIAAAIGFFLLFDAIGSKLASTLGPGITAFLALAAAIGLAYVAFTLGFGAAGIIAGAAALAAGVVGFKAAIGGYDGPSEAPTKIPGLAVGGMISSSGMAMVGEEGPELVNLPKGAQVVNNQSTTSLMKTMEETKVNNTTNNTSASETAMLSVLLRIEKAMAAPATGAGAGQPINVSVQLDKKKVGEATVNYINKKYDVFTST